MPQSAPANDFGLVATATWDDFTTSQPLEDQLAAQDVAVELHELPYIVGMGGNARLMFYVSPRTGKSMTVLAVPHRPDVDQFAEDYYYFEMASGEALAGDVDVRWGELFDRCTNLAQS